MRAFYRMDAELIITQVKQLNRQMQRFSNPPLLCHVNKYDLNQGSAWIHMVYVDARAWIHMVYVDAMAWIHIAYVIFDLCKITKAMYTVLFSS